MPHTRGARKREAGLKGCKSSSKTWYVGANEKQQFVVKVIDM